MPRLKPLPPILPAPGETVFIRYARMMARWVITQAVEMVEEPPELHEPTELCRCTRPPLRADWRRVLVDALTVEIEKPYPRKHDNG